MISPDLRFDHLDLDEWHRLRRWLLPGGDRRPSTGVPRAAAGPRTTAPLVLLLEGGKTVAALRLKWTAGSGFLVEDPAAHRWEGAASLGRLRRAAGTNFAAAIDTTQALRLAAELDRGLRAGDEGTAQLLFGLRAAKGELGRSIFVDPDPFSPIPVPSFAAVQQTLDLLLPDDRAAGLFIFDRGRLATSAIVEKRGGHIVRLTSARALDLRSPDFRDGRHRAILDAMTRQGLRPHACGFLTREALRDVLGPQPGALAQAVALREAVLDPAPPWLYAFAGAGAVAGVAQTAGKLFGRFVPQGLKDSAREASKSFSPFQALGFDPIQLFTDLVKLAGA